MDDEKVKSRFGEIDDVAKGGGYQLNPDSAFAIRLIEGLLVNVDRYGMESCPCRLFRGKQEENQDIVCPCYYRDDDLSEFGACFCALYVTDAYEGGRQIPDRRPQKENRKKQLNATGTLPYPVWRCNICGYLCAKNNPPIKCPVCKADSKHFDRFI